jgi:hypothetical protein
MDPSNIFMLTCIGIIILLAIIYCIHGLGCYKRNTGYNVVELETIINNLPPPKNKDIDMELL